MRDLAAAPAARGLADDVAVITLGGETLVLTHDTLVEGVHVFDGQNAADIAWKLIATNLSDLAGKGAEPLGVLISHMLSDDDDRFVEGLSEVLAAYSVPLLGGDTVRAEGRRVWGCTAMGRATCNPVPDRRGARPGDEVFVTGVFGAAMLGFEALRDGRDADSVAYRRPTPRLSEGRALAPLVTAMMDVSDGLLLDAWRMADASGTTFEIDTASVPVAAATRRSECLRWGDDYELLFSMPAGAALPIPATRIGRVSRLGKSPLAIDGIFASNCSELGFTH